MSAWQLQVFYYLSSEQQRADQNARMRRLICTFIVRIWYKASFFFHGLAHMHLRKINYRFVIEILLSLLQQTKHLWKIKYTLYTFS